MWRTKSLQNFSPGVTCSPTLSLALLLQVKQVDSTVEAGAQFQQVRLIYLSLTVESSSSFIIINVKF